MIMAMLSCVSEVHCLQVLAGVTAERIVNERFVTVLITLQMAYLALLPLYGDRLVLVVIQLPWPATATTTWILPTRNR
ncbi:hypothetical protein ACFOW4_10660 [Micromonospora sp. GCM10011542]|uniref:hypothetical protein n=1 Tax=Micromonospora sp. GCM10011542 TaxID=3317337 RepID=UPI003619B461